EALHSCDLRTFIVNHLLSAVSFCFPVNLGWLFCALFLPFLRRIPWWREALEQSSSAQAAVGTSSRTVQQSLQRVRPQSGAARGRPCLGAQEPCSRDSRGRGRPGS